MNHGSRLTALAALANGPSRCLHVRLPAPGRAVGSRVKVAAKHELLAPTLLRSQTLSALHGAVHRGEIPPDVALGRLARIQGLSIRLLGDAVLRRRAWELAEQLGWAETYEAEYVALTQLQADALVTLDADLANRVEGIVPTATVAALLAG